ncbi:hypothetical protein HAX54_046750, partial [Datura stramonium]|nr:hypothetical protein [Datura stramonium]
MGRVDRSSMIRRGRGRRLLGMGLACGGGWDAVVSGGCGGRWSRGERGSYGSVGVLERREGEKILTRSLGEDINE